MPHIGDSPQARPSGACPVLTRPRQHPRAPEATVRGAQQVPRRPRSPVPGARLLGWGPRSGQVSRAPTQEHRARGRQSSPSPPWSQSKVTVTSGGGGGSSRGPAWPVTRISLQSLSHVQAGLTSPFTRAENEATVPCPTGRVVSLVSCQQADHTHRVKGTGRGLLSHRKRDEWPACPPSTCSGWRGCCTGT